MGSTGAGKSFSDLCVDFYDQRDVFGDGATSVFPPPNEMMHAFGFGANAKDSFRHSPGGYILNKMEKNWQDGDPTSNFLGIRSAAVKMSAMVRSKSPFLAAAAGPGLSVLFVVIKELIAAWQGRNLFATTFVKSLKDENAKDCPHDPVSKTSELTCTIIKTQTNLDLASLLTARFFSTCTAYIFCKESPERAKAIMAAMPPAYSEKNSCSFFRSPDFFMETQQHGRGFQLLLLCAVTHQVQEIRDRRLEARCIRGFGGRPPFPRWCQSCKPGFRRHLGHRRRHLRRHRPHRHHARRDAAPGRIVGVVNLEVCHSAPAAYSFCFSVPSRANSTSFGMTPTFAMARL